MRKKACLLLFGVFALIIGYSSNLRADDLTSNQLIQLMKASAKQYMSMDTKMKATSYHNDETASQSNIQVVREITSRWTQHKKYWKIAETRPRIDPKNGTDIQKEITTYAIHPQWTKRLTEQSGTRPRGLVRPGGIRSEDQTFYTIYLAMWDHCEKLWSNDVEIHEVDLNYDETNNLYELQVQFSHKGPIHKFYVDPTKNFVPIKREFFTNDGVLAKCLRCEQFRKINNDVWVPFKFSWMAPHVDWSVHYEVEKVSVNKPIEESLLDFAFPKGTVVIDEIANLRYIVDDDAVVEETMDDLIDDLHKPDKAVTTEVLTDGNTATILKPEDIANAPLAKEEHLHTSASKAQELLIAQTATKKGHRNSYLILISALLSVIALFIAYRFWASKTRAKT